MMFPLGARLLAAGAVVVTLLSAAAITPAQAQAQTAVPAPSIVVLDQEMILRQSTAAKGVREEYGKHLQSLRDFAQKREGALAETDKELAKQKSLLAPDAFAQKVKAFEREILDYRNTLAGRRRAIEVANQQAMVQVTQAVIKLASEIAQKRGANMVMPKSMLVLVAPNLEITPEVVDQLNKTLPSVAFPSPDAILKQMQSQGGQQGKGKN